MYETNDKIWLDILGGEIVSVFTQAELIKFYIKTPSGEIVRLKIPVDWYSPRFEKKVISRAE